MGYSQEEILRESEMLTKLWQDAVVFPQNNPIVIWMAGIVFLEVVWSVMNTRAYDYNTGNPKHENLMSMKKEKIR